MFSHERAAIGEQPWQRALYETTVLPPMPPLTEYELALVAESARRVREMSAVRFHLRVLLSRFAQMVDRVALSL
jgi:hypothetical protein